MTVWPCNQVGRWGSSASQAMAIPAQLARICWGIKASVANVGEGLDSSYCEAIWGTAVVCLQENRRTVDVHWLPSIKPSNQVRNLPYTSYCWLALSFGSCSFLFIGGLGDCISPNPHQARPWPLHSFHNTTRPLLMNSDAARIDERTSNVPAHHESHL